MQSRYHVSRPASFCQKVESSPFRAPVWLFSLAIFLLVQMLPGIIMPGLLTRAEAQAFKQNQPAPPPWANAPRRVGPQGSKPGKIKPSDPTACADCEVSMKALDLTRVPTERELKMAGQLGGALSPTHSANVDELAGEVDRELKKAGLTMGLRTPEGAPGAAGKVAKAGKDKVKRLQKMNLEFGKAIQKWNKHEYRTAAGMFEDYIKEYPDSPWTGEATMHLGCDAKYNGRFSEAETLFEQVVNATGDDVRDPSYDLNQKAKARWADLDLALGRLDEASQKLQNLLQTDRDWRRRTWASAWLINIDLYKKNAKDLRACGSQALSVVMVSLKKDKAAEALSGLRPPREAGFSLSEMAQLAKQHKVEMRGFKADSVEDLAQLPTPFIVHYDFQKVAQTAAKDSKKANSKLSQADKAAAKATQKQGTEYKLLYRQARPDAASATQAKKEQSRVFRRSASATGHYLVVRKVDTAKGVVALYDPLVRRTYYLSYQELEREWSGKGLVLAKAAERTRVGIAIEGQSRATVKKTSDVTAKANKARVAWLSLGEMAKTFGGCCGHFSATPNKGCCDANDGAGGSCGGGGGGAAGGNPGDPSGKPGKPMVAGPTSSQGSPVVAVNRSSLNVFIVDTPLWYTPPVGPPVEVKISYNSQDSLTQSNPFGNKWMFNYGSYVVEDTGAGGGVVTVFMPDGKEDSYTPDGSGSFTSPAGVFNTLRKLSNTRYELEFQGGDKAIYDIPAGTTSLQPFLVELRDRFGYALTMGYNSDVKVSSITDAQGKVTTLTYGPTGHVILVSDPFGRHARFSYDANGNMVECVDMEGHAFQYTYDWNVNVKELNTAQGPWKFDNVYGNYWQGMRVTDPAGKSETWGYSGYANYSYQDKNNVYHGYNVGMVAGGEPKITGMSYPDGTSTGTTYNYQSGLPNAMRDVRGKTINIAYNLQGQPTTLQDKKGQTLSINYAPNGFDVQSIVNAKGQTADSYTYNSKHQPLTVTNANNQTTTFTYTAWGAPLTITDAQNATTQFNYNAAGRLTNLTRAGSTLVAYTYDNIGRVQTQTDASGQTVGYEYNNLDKVTRIVFSDGTSIAYDYVCCGLVGVVKDRAGRSTYYDYDPMKRLTRVQDVAGKSLFFDYDGEGRKIQMLDAKGNETRWSYDPIGRLSRKTYGDGSFEGWRYDVPGNAIEHISAKGKITAQYLDDNGNLAKIDHADTPDVQIFYDELDRPTKMIDGLGQTLYAFDNAGHLTSVDGPFANDTLTYSYNAVGQRSGADLPGFATSYGYDALSRLQSVTSPAGAFGYSYAGNTGQVAELTMPNGAKTNYAYDGLQRLTQIQSLNGNGSNISNYAYNYDNVTNRAGRTGEVSQVLAGDVVTRAYGYDDVDQLTAENVSVGGQAQSQSTFSYDPMGNRAVTTSTSTAGNTSATASHNRLNQVTAMLTTAANGSSAQANLSYDPNGNLTQVATVPVQGGGGSTTQYAYDDSDRLTSVIVPDTSKSEYLYDGAHRLIVSREFNWQNGAWVQTGEVRRIYDGMDLVQERDAQNNVLATYTRSGNIGGVLARSDNNGHLFYHYDGRGNVTQLSDGAQTVQAQYAYDAWGNVSASGPLASLNHIRFSTKEQMGALVYYGYRFYSASLGRWINRDPIAEKGGLNLYGMVSNNATNRADNYGLIGIDTVAIFFAGAFVGFLSNLAGQIAANKARGFAWDCDLDVSDMVAAAIAAGVQAVLTSLGITNPVVSGAISGALQTSLGNFLNGDPVDSDTVVLGGILGGFTAGLGWFIGGDGWGGFIGSMLATAGLPWYRQQFRPQGCPNKGVHW